MLVRDVPNSVFEKLIGAFVRETAGSLLEQRARSSATSLHCGPSFGHVLAWAWRRSPDEAAAYVADVLAEARYHAKGADRSITLDELLTAVLFAVPDMEDDEAEALEVYMRARVPGYFDGDVTSAPGRG
jgi:hypothetical protein